MVDGRKGMTLVSMEKESRIIPFSDALALGVLPAAEPTPGDPVDSAIGVTPLADELRSAERIQRSLLPHFPSVHGWDISGFCSAAGPLGGDFYDVISFGANNLFVVADVMGKGIPAALIASVLRIVIRNAAIGASGPGEILKKANDLVFEDLSNADMYVTMQAVWLDAESDTLIVAGAGHCPLLVRNRGHKVESIRPGGIPIGVAPKVTYPEETVSLDGIDLVLMYTDGVTEARNPRGESFGDSRLALWLAQAKNSPAKQLKEEFGAVLEDFEAGMKRRDDQTFLLLHKYL